MLRPVFIHTSWTGRLRRRHQPLVDFPRHPAPLPGPLRSGRLRPGRGRKRHLQESHLLGRRAHAAGGGCGRTGSRCANNTVYLFLGTYTRVVTGNDDLSLSLISLSLEGRLLNAVGRRWTLVLCNLPYLAGNLLFVASYELAAVLDGPDQASTCLLYAGRILTGAPNVAVAIMRSWSKKRLCTCQASPPVPTSLPVPST